MNYMLRICFVYINFSCINVYELVCEGLFMYNIMQKASCPSIPRQFHLDSCYCTDVPTDYLASDGSNISPQKKSSKVVGTNAPVRKWRKQECRQSKEAQKLLWLPCFAVSWTTRWTGTGESLNHLLNNGIHVACSYGTIYYLLLDMCILVSAFYRRGRL